MSMIKRVDGVYKRVIIIRPKEFMLNKEGNKDIKKAKAVKK